MDLRINRFHLCEIPRLFLLKAGGFCQYRLKAEMKKKSAFFCAESPEKPVFKAFLKF